MGKAREPKSYGAKFGNGPLNDDRRPCCQRAPTLRWCVVFSEVRVSVLIGGEPTALLAGGSEIAHAAAAPDPPERPIGHRVQPGLAQSPPAPARHGAHSRLVLPKVLRASGSQVSTCRGFRLRAQRSGTPRAACRAPSERGGPAQAEPAGCLRFGELQKTRLGHAPIGGLANDRAS